ncbi:defensin-A-like [Culex pipiens pallens]|uniref:defensin-A-like n=1 Tax=Culex pipiens pallens TaxID=42434 RepID=UPI0019542EA3|nr:defensin-A-like [Culex pipiens pallens]XP_039453840.1 defensin-A-like [Culex pipiens pallens]
MQSVTIFCFALVCFTATLQVVRALPQDGVLTEETYEYVMSLVDVAPSEAEVVKPLPEHHRQRRATCDLLSGFGVNDSACAAHCILRGNRGGYCNGKKVCVCRN